MNVAKKKLSIQLLAKCVTEKLERVKIENVINFITFALHSFAYGVNGIEQKINKPRTIW